MNDSWQSASSYQSFMGRWSSLISHSFLSWLAAPPAQTWLDVGCGTGSLTRLILDAYQPKEVVALDSSPDFIAFAREFIVHPSVRFIVGRAETLDLAADTFDVIVSGFVLNFVPHPDVALLEMLRVVKPGGPIGIVLWDYSAGMEMLRFFWDAASALDPNAQALDEGSRFPICKEGELEQLARKMGMKRVEATSFEIATIFEDFNDFWLPFLGHVGPAPSYTMSLAESDREKLRESLWKSLPVDETGSISLTARAWAIKGTA